MTLLILAGRGEGLQGQFLPTAAKRRIRKKRGNKGKTVKKVGRYVRKEE